MVVVREVSEEVLDGGRCGEGEQRKAFAFGLGIWGVLVVRREVYALYGAVIIRRGEETTQQLGYSDYGAE